MSLAPQARAWLVRGVVLIGSALLTLAVVEGVLQLCHVLFRPSDAPRDSGHFSHGTELN